MARNNKQESSEVRGRALVDIPRVGAKCGDFVSLQPELAAELMAIGEFDPKAVEPKAD